MVLFVAFALLSLAQAPSPPQSPARGGAMLEPDPPLTCGSCAEWNRPRPPFKVYGNTYFVGSLGLSSLLIATEEGLVLIDVALPQSAPLIDANIQALGFRTTDLKYILTSHAHFDHVGGLRSMQRYTGASVLASRETARALALGHPVPEDPQFEGASNSSDFPATTWTWSSCEGGRCLDMVYVDSLTAVSNDTYRFTGGDGRPGIVDTFRKSLRKVKALPCDVVISTHPSATGMDDKVARRATLALAPGAAGDPFVDPGACRALAAGALKALDARVAQEAKTPR
jgi:metallo-beta-lactamase class B